MIFLGTEHVDLSPALFTAAVAPSTLTLPPDPAAVRRARTFVANCCERARLAADTTQVAILLTSEAVTNAFLHGRSGALLTVTADGNGVLVEVGDDGGGHPHVIDLDRADVGGRGLHILSTLAARWGVRNEPVGKTVWFHVAA